MNKRIIALLAAASLSLFAACSGSKEVSKAKEFLAAGMFDQAIVLLKQEIQTNPKNAEAHMLLGSAYLGNGMTALADQEFNTATVGRTTQQCHDREFASRAAKLNDL